MRRLSLGELRTAIERAEREQRIAPCAWKFAYQRVPARRAEVVRAVLALGSMRGAARELGVSPARVSEHCRAFIDRHDGDYRPRWQR